MAKKSVLPKVLLVGSVGLIAAGIFVWWRGKKLAQELGQEMFTSTGMTSAAAASPSVAVQYSPALAERAQAGLVVPGSAMRNVMTAALKAQGLS